MANQGNRAGRKWLIGSGVVAALLVVLVLVRALNQNFLEAQLNEQLRLARSEGLPTNGREFGATMAPAKPEENAAEFYRRLKISTTGTHGILDLAEDLIFKGDSASKAAADARLTTAAADLFTIDEAIARPRCWFNRDWSLGVAIKLPEFSTMRSAARLLTLRAFATATKGNSKSTLRDIQGIFRIAEHAGEEGHSVAAFTQKLIYRLAMTDLAELSFRYREVSAYRAALAEALNRLPRPSIKREHLWDLTQLLEFVEMTTTTKGLATLGLKPGEVSNFERVAPMLLNRTGAKIAIIKAQREAWRALNKPSAERKLALEKIDSDLLQAMLAYPTAQQIYRDIAVEDEDDNPENEWEITRQKYTAFLRAFDGRMIARKIRTDDLLSPIDHKPLSYTFDGIQIELRVSGGPSTLSIPPRHGSTSGFIR